MFFFFFFFTRECCSWDIFLGFAADLIKTNRSHLTFRDVLETHSLAYACPTCGPRLWRAAGDTQPALDPARLSTSSANITTLNILYRTHRHPPSLRVWLCARQASLLAPAEECWPGPRLPGPGGEASGAALSCAAAINHSLLLRGSLQPPCFCNRQRNPSLN